MCIKWHCCAHSIIDRILSSLLVLNSIDLHTIIFRFVFVPSGFFSTSINHDLHFLCDASVIPVMYCLGCAKRRRTEVEVNYFSQSISISPIRARGVPMRHSQMANTDIYIYICTWTVMVHFESLINMARKYLRRAQEFMAIWNELNSTLHIRYRNDKIVYALCHEL